MNKDYLDYLEEQCLAGEEIELRTIPEAGVFAGVNPRKQGTKDVTRQCWFVVDLDNPRAEDLETAKSLKPNILVCSGQGYHLYWKLATPVVLDSVQTRNLQRDKNRQAIKKFACRFKGKADSVVNDPERVLRIPDTVNPKYNKKAYLISISKEINEKFNIWYSNIVVSQSESDFALACNLVQKGIDKASIKEAIREWRNENGDEKKKANREDYLTTTVDNAIKATGGALSVSNQGRTSTLQFVGAGIFANVKETEWLVRDLIPKSSIVFLVGDPKTGKSYFALEAALSVALGRPVAGVFSAKMAKVLFLELEDGLQIMAPRYHGLVNGGGGAEPSPEQFRIYMGHELKFDQESAWNLLCAHCDEFKPELVVIDTLARCHSKDEISAREMTLVLDKLNQLRHLYGCAILVVHHFNKTMYDRKNFGRRTLRGSSTIEAAAEVIIRAQRNELGDAVDCVVSSKVSRETGFSYRLNESIVNGKHIAKIVV